ncbi:MAG TPA: alpha/beta hydrolase-fold protein [Pyrinomonadaceae bacterium]|nr:alpha/beta hydrolase-fold protein [Pyrinomonadaceae bacterium]
MGLLIARKITRILFTLLIMLNANLTGTSSTRPSSEQQTGNAPRDQEGGQEIATTVDDRPLSPRLAKLRDQLKSGNRNALDSFWKEITERGAPIIEGVPGNDRDVLVTILWRAREDTRNAFVFQFGGIDKPMARLLDTDLWYKTFRLQKGARFVYRLATNLPDPKEWTSLGRFVNAMRTDPLNPLQFDQRANELNPYEVTFFSAAELPSAESQFWSVARPKVPTGRVQRDKFTSKALGNERPIWIYTPHEYAASKKPYGLLVLSDGGLYVNSARVATTLDNLIAAGLIPPLVAVMVDNPDRVRELCSLEYADFLAQEIVPWARVNYHVTDRPEQTIIGGASLGGLAAAFIGFKHPEVFGNVLSQSGSFDFKCDEKKDWEWLTLQFAANPRLPLRFSFEAGLLENTGRGPVGRPFGPSLLVANRNLRDTLQSKGYSVHYTEFNGNHTMFNWRGTLASHLIALVGIKPEPKSSAGDKHSVARSIPRKAIVKAEVKVAPALLKRYVGRYELDPKFTHDFVLYVSVKDDSLWVKPGYMRARRVMAESESRFYDSENPDLHLVFMKDERGNVTGLTLNSGTGDIRVKKMPPPVPSVGNTLFKLTGHTEAEAVAIYGSFNNWIQTKNYCAKEVDGWVCRIDLPPGKYTYKFLIDGVGLNDPTNSATEDDGQGHIDSVIVIRPK